MLNRDILKLFSNVFTLIIPPCKGQHHQRWSIPTNLILVERFDNIISVSSIVLEKDFHLRKNVYLTIPPEVNNSTIRKAIGHFQVNIKNIIKYLNYVCCYCNWFVNLLELESIPNNNVVLMAVFETNILHYSNFDICDYYSGFFSFCYDC